MFQTNPFARRENRVIKASPTVLVIFGATGDLNKRKLIPSLWSLFNDNLLPDPCIIIGASRSKLTDDQFREQLTDKVRTYARAKFNDERWHEFCKNSLFYQSVDGGSLEDFLALKGRIDEITAPYHSEFEYNFYLATSPEHFGSIAYNIKESKIGEPEKNRLVIEKPFGVDLESAKKLNAELRRFYREDQLYRIDHYLGKECVQNILVFRFGNGIFEPMWNNRYIESIYINVYEDIGVGSRAAYFDQSGILRDIVQNHVLQMLALLCIEPPVSLSNANSIRDEKVKVLSQIVPIVDKDVDKRVIRGQYSQGFIHGKPVCSYAQEAGVKEGSLTETYACIKYEIDNWRFSGVPIFVRAGKRLSKRVTEILVYFRRPPNLLFKGRQIDSLESNVLRIQVQPDEGISLSVNSKPPGPRLRARPVVMDFSYKDSYSDSSPDAYERLLLDVMKGDPTLFTRGDEIEVSWQLVDPIIEAWRDSREIYYYPAGSYGPKEAMQLVKRQ